MKVKELIAELLKHNHEAEVVVDGYELGVNDVRKVTPLKIYKNENRPYWHGRFEKNAPGKHSVANAQPIDAVYLPRMDDED